MRHNLHQAGGGMYYVSRKSDLNTVSRLFLLCTEYFRDFCTYAAPFPASSFLPRALASTGGAWIFLHTQRRSFWVTSCAQTTFQIISLACVFHCDCISCLDFFNGSESVCVSAFYWKKLKNCVKTSKKNMTNK